MAVLVDTDLLQNRDLTRLDHESRQLRLLGLQLLDVCRSSLGSRPVLLQRASLQLEISDGGADPPQAELLSPEARNFGPKWRHDAEQAALLRPQRGYFRSKLEQFGSQLVPLGNTHLGDDGP